MPTNALDSITINGFKSIASIDRLALRPINVVIGPNGSGKSNFLGAFDFIWEVFENRLDDYVVHAGGAEKVLHFGSRTTGEMLFDFGFGGGHYALRFRPTANDGLYVVGRDSAGAVNLGWQVYHFGDTGFSSPMRKTARVDDNRFLRADGSNLSAFLYLLREKYKQSYDLIVDTVQRVTPFFDDFLLEPLRLKADNIKLEWRHKKSDQYFDASSLSDGTLRFIALATLFLQPERFRPPVVLVDEPELGLHPYALEILTALVRQASLTSQVIVSTQSSLLLDHFEPEDVLVADRVDGGTQLTRLKSPQLAKWLEDYSLGQLWEKNEIGGRPVPG
jgi:predicted ATPase